MERRTNQVRRARNWRQRDAYGNTPIQALGSRAILLLSSESQQRLKYPLSLSSLTLLDCHIYRDRVQVIEMHYSNDLLMYLGTTEEEFEQFARKVKARSRYGSSDRCGSCGALQE